MCRHQHQKIRLTVNERNNRTDPTRTRALRRQMGRQVSKRLREVRGQIRDAIVEKDVFDLRPDPLMANADSGFRWKAFKNLPLAEKIARFIKWLEQLLRRKLLGVEQVDDEEEASEDSWIAAYIDKAFRRGVTRANVETRKVKDGIPSIDDRGGIDTVMAGTAFASALSLMKQQTLADLKTTIQNTTRTARRILTGDLQNNEKPDKIVNNMNTIIGGNNRTPGGEGLIERGGRFISTERSAQTVVRTQVIATHHNGNMQEYLTLGVEEVQLMAELVTAGDDRVCPECLELEDLGPRPIEEVRGWIPVHPGCRCVVKPV